MYFKQPKRFRYVYIVIDKYDDSRVYVFSSEYLANEWINGSKDYNLFKRAINGQLIQ